MPKIALRLVAAILALLASLSAGTGQAAEIKVLCSGAMRGVLQQLAPILPCRIRGDPADARNAAATAAIQFGLRPRRPPGAGGISFDYP
jgi:hypothetical protein